ncbi:MAG: hypothetical protein ACPG5P_04945, partial [Saprospiraceae bacterium]
PVFFVSYSIKQHIQYESINSITYKNPISQRTKLTNWVYEEHFASFISLKNVTKICPIPKGSFGDISI